MTDTPGKHRAPRAVTPVDDDASIPVLTERLTLPPLELDFTLPPAPTVAGQPTEAPAADAPQAPAPAPAASAPAAAPPPAEVPWGRVEIELREAILRDLAERLPTDVEGIVRRQMSVAIDAAVQRLASEARLALASSLREIVDRAVRAELERLRGLKK
ncbi:MAG: hypothetical protein OHK0044_14940 [Burkholderiaceae bacterium]